MLAAMYRSGRRWMPFVSSLLCSLAACGQEGGQDPQPGKGEPEAGSDFARFVPVDDGGHFDTAITRYRNKDGVLVTLFGAVHIADAGHYEQLQDRFAACDALLYELVGPENYRPTRGEQKSGPISMLQNALKAGLELEFQLDAVDYSPANFVHADMTPEEFQESMAERGESLIGLMVKMSLQGMAQPAQGDKEVPQVDLVSAFRSGEGRHQLRMLLASQLEQLETMAALGGEKGSTLLEGRNEKCLEVLQREIKAGKKNLGIYYGAAHLPHLERRLVDDLGFQKVGQEWIVAWDCTKRPDPKFDRELWQARQRGKREIQALGKVVAEWGEANGTDRAPTFDDLGSAWRKGRQDPWGNEYRIARYERAPFFDVHSLGQDGEAGTDDDLHSASARELRRMRNHRATEELDKEAEQIRAMVESRKKETEEAFRRADHLFREAQRTKAETEVKAIANAGKMFLIKNGRIPTMADLTTPDEKGYRYLEGAPQDPWGNDYVIEVLEQNRVRVVSAGPDGKRGTPDDIVSTPKPK